MLQCVNFNPLECKTHYSATLNNMKFGTLAVDGWAVTCYIWYIDEGLPWADQPPPCYTKCNKPPISGQCTNDRIAVQWSVALRF